MRPTVIPDAHIPPDMRRIVVGPPDNDPTGNIRPVEALLQIDDGRPIYHCRIALDPGDLARLARDPHCWLTIHGAMFPWRITVDLDDTEVNPGDIDDPGPHVAAFVDQLLAAGHDPTVVRRQVLEALAQVVNDRVTAVTQATS